MAFPCFTFCWERTNYNRTKHTLLFPKGFFQGFRENFLKSLWLHLFFLFFFFNFYFILLYNTVLVLPYIDMNPPRVYTSFLLWSQHIYFLGCQHGGNPALFYVCGFTASFSFLLKCLFMSFNHFSYWVIILINRTLIICISVYFCKYRHKTKKGKFMVEGRKNKLVYIFYFL